MNYDVSEQKQKILNCLRTIPRKMLTLHGRDNVAAFVLHELGNPHCFNLQKAAYFIDNPDFNCLKGIVGYAQAESFVTDDDIWKYHEMFSDHMNEAPFNQRVRGFSKPSMRKQGKTDSQIIDVLSSQLGFAKEPQFYAWNMKYDNHGLLLYEKVNKNEVCDCDYLPDGACLLAFCPIF